MRSRRRSPPAWVGSGAGFVSGAEAERICSGDGLVVIRPGERRQLSPEEALWAAVLHQALFDATIPRRDEHGRLLVDVPTAAKAWLASASTAPCSCRWICEHLGLDYGYVWAHRDDPTAHRVRPNAGTRTTCKEEAA